MARRHKSDIIAEDIIGGFKVFLISLFVIYFAIAIINSLPDVNFPIKTSSWWLVAFIGAAFMAFATYVKKNYKKYFT